MPLDPTRPPSAERREALRARLRFPYALPDRYRRELTLALDQIDRLEAAGRKLGELYEVDDPSGDSTTDQAWRTILFRE